LSPAAASATATPGAAKRPIRVLLADDHAVTLWGLRQLVESAHPQLSVAGTAGTCAELLAHPALPQTDVVLLDLGLSDANAIDCVAQLVGDLGVKVVVLTGDLNPSHHREAVMRGARGVVLKSQPTQHILDAIQRVHAGEVWLDGSLMSLLLGSVPGLTSARPEPKDDATRRIESLTPKERQVVQMMVAHRGAKSLVVAQALGMSEHTLRNHLTVIYSKLNVQGKLNLYVYALEHGLVAAKAGVPRGTQSGSQWHELGSNWIPAL
jgi:DNA-binding NarL/FixJ family response regulator